MSDKLVTCIIPVFNHEKWVERAIKSVATQDYKNKRIVVVDDGSEDNSYGEISSLLTEKRIIKEEEGLNVVMGLLFGVKSLIFHFDKNHGPSIARNYAIKSAWDGTDYFAFLDSDDFYLPGKISKSVEIFNENPIIGEVYSDYSTINIHTGFTQRQFKEPFSFSRLTQECIINNDSLISKKALEAVGMYDEQLRVCEDYDLHLRINEKFISVHIPEDLVGISVGRHSSTSTVSKELWESCYKRVFDKFRERHSG